MTFNITTEQLINFIEKCNANPDSDMHCENDCPFFTECLHYFTGEECGSLLEQE